MYKKIKGEIVNICIIGGGAAAMAAAITVGKINPHINIHILEKNSKLGKKLAATGNGKCNLSNQACSNVGEILAFFQELGVFTRKDQEGRIYPYNQQAKEVVYGLTNQIKNLNVKVSTDCQVTDIAKTQNGFKVLYKGGEIKCDKVLIASGGKAAPIFGTTGDGYTLAKKLGHKVTRLAPILTGVEIKEETSTLKGIRSKGKVSLWHKDKKVGEEVGEIQFTKDGLSGICIFNLSRFIKAEENLPIREAIKNYRISVDFMPEITLEKATWLLKTRKTIHQLKSSELFLSILPKPLGEDLLARANISKEKPIEGLTEIEISKAAKLLKDWSVQVTGVKGWKDAQCTSGGVDLGEINMDTMESLKVKELYFAGEVIDYDGPCGGFNLQNAWETGIKAGKAMAHV